MRRCLGCYESKPKKELIRVVKTSEGEICIDKTGKKNGRGAYICYNKECLEKAIKAKRLEKELADEKLKTKVLNMMIDISDKQYGTQIRKKFTPKQSDNSKKKD